MNKTSRMFFVTLLIAFYPIGFEAGSSPVTSLVAVGFFESTVTAESLKQTYEESKLGENKDKGKKVKILIVPGHDAEFSGAEFGGLKEADLNLQLTNELYKLLRAEPLFEVVISRTDEGYQSWFLNYIDKNERSILRFVKRQKAAMARLIKNDKVEEVVNVEHNKAPEPVALKLFGINKWANDNDVDIVLHVHFNDYPGRLQDGEGKYSGFVVYIPEGQYANASGSKAVAEKVYGRLAKLYPHSNLPGEHTGIVEDQELIAIGSNNTLKAASMLIEYGYIYEPAFSHPDLQRVVLPDLALQTYLGIMDFFGEIRSEGGGWATRLVPYTWLADIEEQKDQSIREDVLRLQVALSLEGVYPPVGQLKNDCGLTGYFGACTKAAVIAFQQKHRITPAEGYVGAKTRGKLNELY